MNTIMTDHRPYEYAMPREKYRRMLIASRMPRQGRYSPVEPSASIWECIALALFAAAMLGGLAEILPRILR